MKGVGQRCRHARGVSTGLNVGRCESLASRRKCISKGKRYSKIRTDRSPPATVLQTLPRARSISQKGKISRVEGEGRCLLLDNFKDTGGSRGSRPGLRGGLKRPDSTERLYRNKKRRKGRKLYDLPTGWDRNSGTQENTAVTVRSTS